MCCISYKFHLIQIKDCKLVTGTRILWYRGFVSNLCLEWMCKEPLDIVIIYYTTKNIFQSDNLLIQSVSLHEGMDTRL